MYVATRSGRSPADVAQDSYALTLFTWGHLVADAQRDRLLRHGDDLELADAITIGFHKPAALKDCFTRYADRLNSRETPEEAMSNSADLLARVAEADAIARAAAVREGGE